MIPLPSGFLRVSEMFESSDGDFSKDRVNVERVHSAAESFPRQECGPRMSEEVNNQISIATTG